MAEIRAVYDTNILVSAFIGKGAPYKALMAVYDGKVRLITSHEILLELEDVLSRPKFRYEESHIHKIIALIFQASKIVEPDIKVDLVKADPRDNKIIEAAIVGKAEYIVTGDAHHLLPLKKVGDIRIISVTDFLKKVK
jgi:uncharacterized protein